ncbi:MAG: glycosyltransferase, partial [Acidobacteriaceae bacterium]|nr:glycosyltransferase [Acidobacteriaceae bacterium]
EGYLSFLGRIAPEKGPDVAIRLAQASGLPLRIAAKVPRGENQFFEEKIEPLVDHSTIRFIGEVDDQGKATLLQGAAALLFPIDWPEPFGIVMIEAMACGTPVIAWRRGSVAEIIEEGVTGFIVETEAEASAAIGRIETLDRKRIRQAFESRFTSARMAEDYVRAYERVSLSATKKSGQHSFR